METVHHQFSPCSKDCIMDPVTNYCRGCFRTIEEIIQWSHFSQKEREEILKLAETRKLSIRKKNLH